MKHAYNNNNNNNYNNNNYPNKRQKNYDLNETKSYDEIKENIFQQCRASILEILRIENTPDPNKNIELEFRIGEIDDRFFYSIVNGQRFNEILNYFRHNYLAQLPVSNTVDYTYTDNKRRITQKENGELFEISKAPLIKKINIDSRPLFFFDFRFSASSETKMEMENDSIKEEWNCKREKERTSFISHGWQIDFTRVVQHSKDNEGELNTEVKYEIEIEYINFNDFRNPLHGRLDDLIRFMITKLMLILVDINGNIDTKFHCYTKRVNQSLIEHLKAEIWKMLAPQNQNLNNPSSLPFPGSMPVAFSRRHLQIIQKNNYFVSEKTDGTRYMLLINHLGAFIFGRKFDFLMLREEEFPLKFLAKNGVTLLDGELVWHEEHNRYMYMMFDVLFYEGVHVGKDELRNRFASINRIVQHFRKKYFEPDHSYSHLFLFEIIGKTFYLKGELDKLNLNISMIDGDRVYRDTRRFHKTDGIIFTPDTPYHLCGTDTLYKWKYPTLLSVDFKVKPHEKNKNQLMFYCTGTGNVDVPCRKIELNDDLELKGKLFQIQKSYFPNENFATFEWIDKLPNPIIVEVTYNTVIGKWCLCKVRSDKIAPNFSLVVIDTMEALAENVCFDELMYRLKRAPESDCWDSETNKFLEMRNSSIKKK